MGDLGKKKRKGNAVAEDVKGAEIMKADSQKWLSHVERIGGPKKSKASHRGHRGESTESTEELLLEEGGWHEAEDENQEGEKSGGVASGA